MGVQSIPPVWMTAEPQNAESAWRRNHAPSAGRRKVGSHRRRYRGLKQRFLLKSCFLTGQPMSILTPPQEPVNPAAVGGCASGFCGVGSEEDHGPARKK